MLPTLLSLLACAVAAISMTLSKSTLFARPREWTADHIPALYALWRCPYCVSHWVALGMLLGVTETANEGVMVFIMLWFAVVALASVPAFVIQETYFKVR